jgi:hypothetical protein
VKCFFAYQCIFLNGEIDMTEYEQWLEKQIENLTKANANQAARIAALEAASAEAFARWYFIDCQGLDYGTTEKWLSRFRERRDG